jgi:hypothetical protein
MFSQPGSRNIAKRLKDKNLDSLDLSLPGIDETNEDPEPPRTIFRRTLCPRCLRSIHFIPLV